MGSIVSMNLIARWDNVEGYSDEEVYILEAMIKQLSAVIICLAREGGFENASGF